MDDEATLLERKQAIYKSLDEKYVIHGQKYKGQQYSQIYFARLRHLRNLLKPLVATWKPHLPGIGLALHGKKTSEGDFFVENFLEAGLPQQIKVPACLGADKYVVFISGLNVGSNFFNPLQFQLFVDHVTGHLGGEKEQKITSQIVRIVFAGDFIVIPQSFLHGQFLTTDDQLKLIEPIKELDILLMQLAAAVPLDIMPGPTDPANFFLPQQPLHKCLFPGASSYNTFFSCTNPHQFELDSFLFLGTSGQNINDLDKYSSAKSKLEFVERTLRWRHLAPTTPNTLGCYPFTEQDPFFIENCPNVYFVGNQDKYETHLLHGPEKQLVRLICIPRFCESGVAVMLNLKDFKCHALSFSADLDT